MRHLDISSCPVWDSGQRSSAVECKLRVLGSQVQVSAHAQEIHGVEKMKTILMQHTFDSSVGL